MEDTAYDHNAFQPWRLQALAFKALRIKQPDYPLWRDFPYEYELDRLAIDVINGSPLLREWTDDAHAMPEDLETITHGDEQDVGRSAFGIFVVLNWIMLPEGCQSHRSILPSIQISSTPPMFAL